jgi:SAM-dependent methyltransferase
MPSVEDNRRYWGNLYDWPDQGDEWSAPWGGADTHWHATLLPRVRTFLPTGTVLEIAPGYGRWSGYLIAASERYVGVDLAESCVALCRERFRGEPTAEFHVNDGRSLAAVEDAAVDFVFSFDSLVHAEADVIADYVRELSRKLSPEGIGFLHHSNLGQYGGPVGRAKRVEATVAAVPLAGRVLRRLGATGWDQSRAPSMTAQKFAGFCADSGLVCVGQELVNWGFRRSRLVDCLSVVARPGSRWDRPNVVVRNPYFMSEARSARALAQVFASLEEAAKQPKTTA